MFNMHWSIQVLTLEYSIHASLQRGEHVLYTSYLLYHIFWGYTFPLGLLMGKRAALRPLMPPSAAAVTGPCCAPPPTAPCSGRISETRAQLPTLPGRHEGHRTAYD